MLGNSCVPIVLDISKMFLESCYEHAFCFSVDIVLLTHKQLDMHEGILSPVATDTQVQKHQAISTHSAEQICIAVDQFHRKTI